MQHKLEIFSVTKSIDFKYRLNTRSVTRTFGGEEGVKI